MNDDLMAALSERLTMMADNELLLGHRNSEWTGHAPLIEEDIAVANLAQDEIGHALRWYQLRSSIDGSVPDELAFGRQASDFRSCALVALPRGDWAFTMLRQFLFDSYEAELLPRLSSSAWEPLAAVSAKIVNEELFHLRHSRLWLERLALGTAESRRRLLAACERALPALPGLLAPQRTERDHELLSEAGYFPASDELVAAVNERLSAAFEAVQLDFRQMTSAASEAAAATAADTADADLIELVTTMQSVARADPEAAVW